MNESRFSYDLLDKCRIKINIRARPEALDQDGKYIDQFFEKSFELDPKELMTLAQLLKEIGFEHCKKHNCRLDEPVCY